MSTKEELLKEFPNGAALTTTFLALGISETLTGIRQATEKAGEVRPGESEEVNNDRMAETLAAAVQEIIPSNPVVAKLMLRKLHVMAEFIAANPEYDVPISMPLRIVHQGTA